MTMKPMIQIKTRLHEGIYKSLGGGETRVVAEYNYGPRNLVRAYRELQQIRAANKRNFGNIGCGHTWLEISDGRMLSDTLCYADDTIGHAEQVKVLEAALLTREQIDAMDRELRDEVARYEQELERRAANV